MIVNQYILLYENGIKSLKAVKTMECDPFEFYEEDTKEMITEKIVDHLTTLLNENFDLGYLAEEHLFLVAMDAQYKILGIFEISHGTETGCHAGAKEIFTRLLMIGAECFVQFHNHPKGGSLLSDNDVENWLHLKEVAEVFGMEMLTSAVVSGEANNYLEE